jgi:hypothetical protein
MGNLQSIMEELIECLKKYDKDHKNFYETHKEEIISKLLKAFGNPTNIKYICTEDLQVISDTSRRVDAYVDTGANKYALEVKLSLTTGASLGRGLFSKVKQTLERLNINDRVVLVIVIPESNLENARDQLRKRIMSILRKLFNVRLGQEYSHTIPRLN